ncbi:tRNA (guanosine(18)-2'-O)-methyltransferase TrmH [Marinobacterium sediminicola]|uniref:tRNA (guanosine(18)-2'-O)-methyltransferase n=1 Tax=Marinobacterium sediminicola TaxID=518898 RepID=A0ABY1RWK2_9GAMM|nr:tRNA (guanosine(18)-2'-O)-methyltransferase TrmH [Marinobacterium sediminicola]ULG70404.1 tRNA (guanosine(18)-2'-O)-methyltransferase TrmH [Marinobacterium sediminicola]SMR69456.1 tRNA (guanosine-2'-O-)-methyltransferase [Marinobacterium sediminicola]
MTPEREQKLLSILQRRQPDLTLIAEQVHKPRNISALIRNCDAAGIAEVQVVRPREGYHNYRGTALGSDRWVDTALHDTLEAAITAARDKGMMIYAAHFSDEAIPYREVDYTRPCAIIMGAEKEGISPRAAELADRHIIIPMQGVVSSLNVSTAAGIILAEAIDQRLKAGLYDKPRMPAEWIARKMFESRHPKVAEFCRRRRLAYPEFDEVGEMVAPQAWNEQVTSGRAPVLSAD